MTWKHGASGYRSYGCRCDVCTAANTERARTERATRSAGRVLINGALVAVDASTHGSRFTYNNWGCRCPDCAKANADHSARYRATRPARRVREVPA